MSVPYVPQEIKGDDDDTCVSAEEWMTEDVCWIDCWQEGLKMGLQMQGEEEWILSGIRLGSN